MTELADFDLPFSKVEQQVLAWMKEALELRHGTAGDPKGSLKGAQHETPAEITDLLLRVRARSDRVDELLSRVTIARGRARRAREEAQFAADRRLMEATQERAGKLGREYETGKEREADAKLEAFEERRIAHQGERLVSVTNDAYDVVNQCHWQLDAIRKDLRAQLHALQFESSLER